MILDYDMEKAYQQSIEIEDIGNVCLKCTTSDFDEYYISTQTLMGKTYILKFGPVMSDIIEPLDYFSLSYIKIDYDEDKIEKEFDRFINGKVKIKTAEVVELAEAFECIPVKEAFIPR